MSYRLIAGALLLALPACARAAPPPNAPAEVAKKPRPALHRGPLTDFVASAGLRWMLVGEPAELLANADVARALAYAENFSDTDQRPLRAILERFEPPLLVVHGEADFLVPAAAAREHHRIVPQSELAMLDQSHFLLWTRTDAVAARDVVNSLPDAGVGTGCAPRRFCPNEPLTRAQLASLLVRTLPGLTASSADRFVDLPDGYVHTGAINALADAGITRGCSADRFCPTARVTRAQLASFVVRALER